VEVRGHHETWPIVSKRLRRWLYKLFYDRERKPPGSEGIRSAIEMLMAKAEFDGPEHEVFVRIAEAGGAIYVDLVNDDWEAIEITATGWRVVSLPPVRFVRPGGLLPLPRPVAGGSLEELRGFANLSGDVED